MSNNAISATWKADIQPAARKLVLLFMADSLNDKTGQLNPSIDAVARACGMSAAQARRHLHALIDAGCLSVIGNSNGGYHREASRRYQLHLDTVTPCMDATPSTHATPCTDARDPLHPRTEPLASMHETPCTHASQTRKNHKEPEGNQKVTRANRADVTSDAFATFWNAYPKKVGRQAAEKAFARVKQPADKLALILKALAWQTVSEQWQRDGGQFIPNPATYINQGRWDDEQPTATSTTSKAHTSRHSGFEKINYREGINDDGSFS